VGREGKSLFSTTIYLFLISGFNRGIPAREWEKGGMALLIQEARSGEEKKGRHLVREKGRGGGIFADFPRRIQSSSIKKKRKRKTPQRPRG